MRQPRGAVLLLIAALGGCAQLVGNLPTFEYCSDVTYVRHGNQIDVTAKCAAPIGQSGMPVPLPVKP